MRRFIRSLRVGQRFGLAAAVLAVILTASIVVAGLAEHHLTVARNKLVDRITPAQLSALRLENAYINEETGVRGFVLGHNGAFLAPYETGRADERVAVDRLRDHLAHGALPQRDIHLLSEVLAAARAWQVAYAEPVLLQGPKGGRTAESAERGKADFDAIRRKLARLDDALTVARRRSRTDLHDAARVLSVVLIGVAALLVIVGILAAIALRIGVTNPLARLGRDVRRVAGGDFAYEVQRSGPADLEMLGQDVEAMRLRIVEELQSVEDAKINLERSNSELEQFAYVASHDLQEPLRKVASFTQLLQRKYQGQLDERADQYIEFAVDGAKRMQILINDLLAFSRVGRSGDKWARVPLADAVGTALANLDTAVIESGVVVEVGELPVVDGDAGLLSLAFMNLIGNAIKFRGDAPPRVSISARRDEDEWEVTCADNGIGIEAAYADRVFVIFQRLHAKEKYAGTGIGLAMCRKIIEHHGGRIWVDIVETSGTTFRFTLPVTQEIQS